MKPYSFLIVDDEHSVLMALQTIVRRLYPNAEIQTAHDGAEAWDIIQKDVPSIVISDVAMPQMDGIELCKRTKSNERLANIYFIIITAFSSKEQRINALENGADDFLAKPVSADELLARLRAAARIVQLQNQLQEENAKLRELNYQLKRDLEETINMSAAFLTSRMPESKDKISRLSRSTWWIAKKFGDFDEQQIENIRSAAHLCLIGKLYLPDSLLNTPVTIDGAVTDNLMYQVPIFAQNILSPAKRFEKIGIILRHVFENYDGTGFPDKLQTREIPLESRIIRVALDFEELRSQFNLSPMDAFARLQKQAKHLYDPRFLTILEEYLWTSSPDLAAMNVRAMQLYDLEPGMVIARDLVTNAGLKLVPGGTALSEKMIERLISHASSDPIITTIYVRK